MWHVGRWQAYNLWIAVLEKPTLLYDCFFLVAFLHTTHTPLSTATPFDSIALTHCSIG
jgi:hypothetical protein